jgi:hypothetical protein
MIRERLKTLQDINARGADEEKKAYDASIRCSISASRPGSASSKK